MTSGRADDRPDYEDPPETIPTRFFSTLAGRISTDDTDDGPFDRAKPALLTHAGSDVRTITREALEAGVKETARGLIALGISPGERVAILLENSPEWLAFDLAAASIGAVTVPIYTTLGAEDTAFILDDSDAVALVYSPDNSKKVQGLKGSTRLKHIITTGDDQTFSFEGLKPTGSCPVSESEWRERMRSIDPSDPMTIIYTSGTTGRSKGVVLSHANLLANIDASCKAVGITSREVYLSYLPMSHVFERMVHLLMVIKGATVAYSRGFAFVGADITRFRPTVMCGVPFFFDRVKARVLEGARKAGTVKKLLLDLAMALNRGTAPGGPVSRFFDRLVLSSIRERIAPGLRFFISGGAALPPETAEFFWALGIPVIEGYGLTETSPVVSVNTIEDTRIGTVGRPVAGVEVKLDDEGEVLVRGPSVMMRYHKMPEATESALRDGWFHTGDIGRLDDEGFLSITDRKKDLIITSVGKNLSPQRIETALKGDEFIKEALVYGDGRAHLTSLIVPDVEMLASAGIRLDGCAWPIFEGKAVRFIEKKVRTRLKTMARFEQIRRFALIEDTLTTEGGELTPTMKVKRAAVAKKYHDVIERLYRG